MIQEIAQNGQNLKYCIHEHCANWGKYKNFQRTLRVLWGNFKILGQNIHPCQKLIIWFGTLLLLHIRYRHHNFTQLSFISDLLHSLFKMHLVQAFAALSYLVIAGMTGNICYWADVQCESGTRSSVPTENQYCVNNKSM